MTKKAYMKPTMNVVILQQNIICISDNYGMNRQLQGTNKPDDEVDAGW